MVGDVGLEADVLCVLEIAGSRGKMAVILSFEGGNVHLEIAFFFVNVIYV